jgi:hypothetical protein
MQMSLDLSVHFRFKEHYQQGQTNQRNETCDTLAAAENASRPSHIRINPTPYHSNGCDLPSPGQVSWKVGLNGRGVRYIYQSRFFLSDSQALMN